MGGGSACLDLTSKPRRENPQEGESNLNQRSIQHQNGLLSAKDLGAPHHAALIGRKVSARMH
jgi:hypothetical protein